jgi:CubicO group peptidase (beta-lactamase class C family)
MEIEGTCDQRFEAVRELFAAGFASGEDVGAGVALMLDGELVVDLWGGWRDEARTERWARDTIVNVWSSTKTMVGLAALVLASTGDLDLDAPVARYWPEFAANGKRDVLVRHLLSHTSGVSGWAQPVTVEDLYDWDRSTAMLARQEPWWQPGTASGYHMIDFGHLTGEVIRRITGLRLGEFLAAHVTGPLGADFHVGLPASEHGRVAPVIPPPDPAAGGGRGAIERDSVRWKTVTGPALTADVANTEAWRLADIGGGNGHGNARSVALVQSVLSCGGPGGAHRLVRDDIAARVFDVQADGVDLVVGVPFRLGIGYGLRSDITPHLPAGRVCWWGGWGGSLVVNDLDRRASFAYMMNRMGPSDGTDTRAARLAVAALAAAGAPF